MKDNSGYFIQFPTILLEHLNMRQAVLVGVLTSMSNKHGYAYAHNETLSNILKIHLNTLKSDLKTLEKMGVIRREVIRNEKKEVIQRKIFLQHSYLDKLLVPTSTQDKYPPSGQSEYLPPDKDCAIDKDIDIDKIDKIIDTPITFETIWGMYGRVGNKKTSSEKWDTLTPEKKQTIAQHIPVYIKHHIDNDKMEYVPHFTTYLNQERWNDTLPYSNKSVITEPFIIKNKATLNDD
jgi:DNA-binding Lrp family transcriptional regulator